MEGYQLTEEDYAFVCPISNDIFQDPVKAEDGRTYDRSGIEAWFASCRQRGLPIVSPWTRKKIGTQLKADAAAASGAAKLRKRVKQTLHNPSCGLDLRTALQGISSIHQLRKAFALLDPLRDILEQTLDGWQPPQLVVIGQESSGKSTMMERLAMMPIFPQDRRLCTRLPIHVRLRNVDKFEPATLEVYNCMTGKTEEEPYVIPTEYGAVDVRDKMQEIIQKEHGNAAGGVSMDRIIILTVKSPYVPSIDMVDLPGLVTAPESMKKSTRKLVDDHIDRHGAYSLYLATVVATSAPNLSTAMEVVETRKLQSKTIGVFTKCNKAMADEDDKESFLERLRPQPPADCGAVRLKPYGWVCVMNSSVLGSSEQSSFARLKQQAVNEEVFMQDKLQSLLSAGNAGCGALVERICKVYTQFLSETWGPKTIKLLCDALEETSLEDALLGKPEFHKGGAESAGRARHYAAEQAKQIVVLATPRLVEGCCREKLQALKDKLLSIAGQSIRNVQPSEAAVMWREQKDKFTAACKEGVEQWASYWASEVRKVLEARDPKPTSPQAKKKILSSPPFVLGRFPSFIGAIIHRLECALALHKDQMLRALEKLITHYYGMDSQWVTITTTLSGAAPSVTFDCNYVPFVENIIYCFLDASSCGILDDLKGSFGDIACIIPDLEWIEDCKREREQLEERVKNLGNAKAQLEVAKLAEVVADLMHQFFAKGR
jgi:GTP-binding protein EngB required for normal cell division